MARNGGAFDTNRVLNNFSNWRRVVIVLKNGIGSFSFEINNGLAKMSERVSSLIKFF